MRGALAALIVFGCATVAEATVYNFTGVPYSTAVNFVPPCAGGPCANYDVGGDRIVGSLTTSSPLAPNLFGANISSLVTSFRFNDGINTYSSDDPNVRRILFTVQTDSSGNIVEGTGVTTILLQLWQTGTRPHTTSDRTAFLTLGGMEDRATNNAPCPMVSAAPSPAGDTDWCEVQHNSDSASSTAFSLLFGTWSIGSSNPAPVLSTWSTILLLAALFLGGGWWLRHTRAA
jgi:hypothetical protein